LRHARTVANHEWSLAGGRHLVECAGNQFLSRSGATAKEHSAEVRSDAAHDREDLEHLRAASDHTLKLKRGGEFFVQCESVALRPYVLERLHDAGTEAGHRNRLGQVIGGAFFYCLDRSGGGVIAGQEEDFDGRVKSDDLFEHLHAVHIGHVKIQDEDFRTPRFDTLQGDAGIRVGDDFEIETPQGLLYDVNDDLLIVHDQHRC